MNKEFVIDSLLKQMADGHRPELPSPGLVWWRAQIVRKRQEKQQIERPLLIMRGVAAAACVAAFVVFLVGSWRQLELTGGDALRLLVPLLVTVLVASLGLVFLVAGSSVKRTSSRS